MKKFVFICVVIMLLGTHAAAVNEYDVFTDVKNVLSADDALKIHDIITACADIMSFDIKNYDYDNLFKYALYTHENFKILTDISPENGTSGSGGVSLVSAEFMDYVMSSIFRITPQKPPPTQLLGRGFCFNNGYYMYSGGFDVFFATEIKDIDAVYELGNETYLVLFSDIYYENGMADKENSFAILRHDNDGFFLMRLGMGENPPSPSEAFSYGEYVYENKAQTENGGKTEGFAYRFLLPVLLLIIGVGVWGIITSVVRLVKMLMYGKEASNRKQ